jgi:hypothetical protein
MIGGFIIDGNAPKKVVVRAIGPSLTKAGVAGAMANPTLDLHNSTGAVIATSDNWTSRRTQVQATGLAPTDGRESAIVATLPPGAYTAILRGVGGSTGVALIELYDIDPAHSRIAGISTRGKVLTGDSVMIGGFIIGGDQPRKVIVRAIGPSLERRGVTDALKDPMLELHGGNGSIIVTNNDWRSSQEEQIMASTIPPSDEKESAVVATLKPGPYTAVVRGVANSTGVALVEVYDLTK